MTDIDEHAARIAAIVEAAEASDDEASRARVFELLEHIDHLHRTCVWRLFELMTELGGKGFVERIAADPLVKTLFVLYDLVPTESLRPLPTDVRVMPPTSSAFIPLRSVGGRKPAWKAAFRREDLPPGALRAAEIEGVPVLVFALDDDDRVFAYRNACPGSALPLHLGTLSNGELHCPWHGCRFDAASGRQIGGSALDLEPLAVSIRDGAVHVATSPAAPGVDPR